MREGPLLRFPPAGRRRLVPLARILAAVLALAGCGERSGVRPTGGTQVLMSFDRAAGFYSAPFPSEDLRRADGTIDLAGFPNPYGVQIIARGLDLLRGARGFAVSGGAFFQLSAEIDPSHLPDPAGSVSAQAPIFLLCVDPSSPDHLRRTPVEIAFEPDAGPFGAKNLLSLLPVQGIPLRSDTTYAAVVLRGVLDATGQRLGVSREMAEIAAGRRPAALPVPTFVAYRQAMEELGRAGVRPRDVAGLAVFTTGTPTAEMELFRQDLLSRPLPAVSKPFRRGEVFDDYCVYETTIGMPDYQSGEPPFLLKGGGWQTDATGRPVLQRTEEANFVVTIPRAAMPAAGFPSAVFIRTGGGGERPLVDRGVQAVPGGPALVPGSGPALQFARAGFAGVSVDGPLGGLRNTTHGDEQFLIFNVLNPAALRDNVRQSALETILIAHILRELSIDTTDCPAGGAGGSPHATFDSSRLALMGHSMGATIAPLALAYEPMYGVVVLSGAGGSWIENILYKKKPLDVRPLAELILGYAKEGRSLTAADPVLSLVQWAAEPADPQVYASRIVREPAEGERPRNVLMLQGIVDHYILPDIANALSLPLGLDLAGEALDAANPALEGQTPLSSLLPLVGRSRIAFPVSGNTAAEDGHRATAVVVQHPEDGIEDGHEVVFQTEAPKHQYTCFLQSFGGGRGEPRVPAGAASDAPCD